LVAVLIPLAALAQPTEEARAYEAAVRAFQDAVYDRAESLFADFARRYPNSARLPEAILLQAQAAMQNKGLQVAIDLLSTNAARAGKLADQYRYRLAETYMRASNYLAAAEAFARIPQEFPDSARVLESAYGEALARFRLKQWPRVHEILQKPDSAFQRAAKLRPNDELVVRGNLLLGEALFEQRQLKAAISYLKTLREKDLTPELKWHWHFLLCRALLRDQQFEGALRSATNLIAAVPGPERLDLLAESVVIHARVFEHLGDWDSAARIYERNLAPEITPERRRYALLKTIQLTLAQDRLAEAAQKLQNFVTANPEEATSEVALLTLGELHLKQHLAQQTNSPALTNALVQGITNHLQTAFSFFSRVATNLPPGPLRGQGWLYRGWCSWMDRKYPDAQAAFKAGGDLLPYSKEKAVARFKLGDTFFIQNDFTNALVQYRIVTSQFPDLPPVRDGLLEAAWHQVLRVSLQLGDSQIAHEAMTHILDDFPNGSFGDRSLLIAGQHLANHDQPAEGRKLFARFAERYPKSPLLPEVELAAARAFVREENWPGAIKQYSGWLERFKDHPLRAKAQFDLAGAHFRAGNETNALNTYTNLLAEFPTNEFAPRVQFWIGDYYWRAEDYVNAEKSYQRLFQNSDWAAHPLACQARMMAGRAAFARQNFAAAEDYFKYFVSNDQNCSADLVAEALFALGDTYTRQDVDPAKPLAKFSLAREAFERVTRLYPASPLTPPALGRIGDCYLQLATQDPQLYEAAAEAYSKAMSPAANVHVRSQAEIGLAIVREKQAATKTAPDSTNYLKMARDHYLNVLHGVNLRDGEQCSPQWAKEAGFAAARLAEDQQEWEVAANIYKRMASLLPPLRAVVEKKLERAERLRASKPL
jgi:TolA-binding protein